MSDAAPTPVPSISERLDRFELDLRPDPPMSPPAPEAKAFLSTEPASHNNSHNNAAVTTLEHPRTVVSEPRGHVLSPTNDLIDRMWSTDGESQAFDGWTILELDTESSAVARRVFIGTVLTVAIALMVASAWFLTGRGDATVQATLAEIDDSTEALSEVLAGAEPVIEDFATGELTDREAAAATSTALDAAARTLFAHASELPTAEEWAAVRSSIVSLSDRSIDTARLLSRTASYVATIEVMFNRPAYPLTADDAEIGDTAEMTAIWVSRFIATSSSLPEVTALAPHRLEVEALAATLPDWQSRYLDALRAGDIETAGTVVLELEDAILGLEAELADSVRSIATELSERRSSLLADLGA